ncbi:hypothetical protein [Halomonas daqiaonensis]|uniref:hypothetical protein n=1 Tax=Halomonas daqiaonensis TaxID=650850 RepID=UPI001113F88B|nr:hypothetical protein [Halomonas daqiaonensis]
MALTLVSQFAKLLAFFLPLKVIILIGSTGIPHYFPDAWAAFDRDFLVVALSFTTLLFYLVHLLAERLLGATAAKGAAGVVERSRKLALFSNQDEVASQAYKKLAAGLATGVLTALLGVLFAILYPAFLAVMVAYVVGVSAVISLVTQKQPERRVKLQENAKNLIGLLSGGGFLLLFAFMVTDFLLWEGVSFMVAIISLLLSRQLLNRVESMIKDALWLHDKRLQINAIFFTGHRLETGPENPRHRKLWELLTLVDRPERLIPLLEHVSGTALTVDSTLTCRWRQSGLIDILVFDVELRVPGSEPQGFLLKVFDSRHKKAALNEAELLASATGRALPAPELRGVDQLERFDVHLLRFPAGMRVSRDAASNQLADRLVRCWQVVPGKNLVDRYRRSHPFLHQRFSSRMLERLAAVAADSTQRAQVDQLARRFDALLAELGKLPLVVINPGVPRELTFVTDSSELQLAHWGNWTLEPVGADFPLGMLREGRLQQVYAAAAEQRDDLKAVPIDRIRLCAQCSAFETFFNKQKYADALALLSTMLRCLQQLESPQGDVEVASQGRNGELDPASEVKDS